MNQFISGAIAMGYAMVALNFFRFWKSTRERLFLIFALAFVMLTCEQTILSFLRLAHESRPLVYLIRLAAFSLIGAGIVDKNRTPRHL